MLRTVLFVKYVENVSQLTGHFAKEGLIALYETFSFIHKRIGLWSGFRSFKLCIFIFVCLNIVKCNNIYLILEDIKMAEPLNSSAIGMTGYINIISREKMFFILSIMRF